jgi:hypothetical protein
MIAANSTMEKFNLTARLFKLVSDMPKDQQLRLLKRLVGDRVAAHLYKLIVEMTEEQQIILLEQMGQLPKADLPVNMVSLEETESSMRENPRKPWVINTSFVKIFFAQSTTAFHVQWENCLEQPEGFWRQIRRRHPDPGGDTKIIY